MDENQSGKPIEKPSQPADGNIAIKGLRVPPPPPPSPPPQPPQQPPSTPQKSGEQK